MNMFRHSSKGLHMILMHQVFGVADPLKVMELIFSTEWLLIKMVFSESRCFI